MDMYAFLTNHSALEAVRFLGNEALAKPHWPSEQRRLPRYGDCVSSQRAYRAFNKEENLSIYGVNAQPTDLLVPDADDRRRGQLATFHVWKNELPVGAMLRLSKCVFVATPQFVLLQMAAHNQKATRTIDAFHEELHAATEVQFIVDAEKRALYDDPFEWVRKERIVRMALIACEFAGFYRLPAGDKDTQYGLKPFMTRNDARTFAESVPRLYGRSRVRQALSFSYDQSASPMETALVLMLTLPVKYGGYGLPRPCLNKGLALGDERELWDGGDHITPDLLWEEAKVVIEYESGEFHYGQGMRKATNDATRANVLSAMGYVVLRATAGSVTSLVELDRLTRQVATLLGVDAPQADDITSIRRHKLHALLMNQ